jgi:hypothetical protein
MRRTLVWNTAYSSAMPANTYTEFIKVCLNGPYDPDNAVGGSSAVGYAKYMAFYSKCFVLGARIKVKGARTGTAGVAGAGAASIVGITVNTNNSSIGSYTAAIGEGLTDYTVMSEFPDRTYNEMGLDIAKFMDKPDVLDDPTLFNTSSSIPTEVVYAHVWGQNLSAAANEYWVAIVEVEFDCVFTDPIPFT